jgi:hypothetical protein
MQALVLMLYDGLQRNCLAHLKSTAFRIWADAVRARRRAQRRADAAHARRRLSLLSAAFSVWALYARTMQQQPDLASPFSMPRSAAQDQQAYYQLALVSGAATACDLSPDRLPHARRVVSSVYYSKARPPTLGRSAWQSAEVDLGQRYGSEASTAGSGSWPSGRAWSEYDDDAPGHVTPVLKR